MRLVKQKRGLGTAAFGVPDQVEDFNECVQEECAWWYQESKECVVKHALGKVENLVKLLENLPFAPK